MACSPKRPDPLRDAEARVRALTREVGTLREDLRRETKKRERAVAQVKENEEARRVSDARAQELSYSNRKLASELDSLHEAARVAAERDRRALRSLREGLAAVEEAVAARARKGFAQVQILSEAQQQLRQLLFGSPAAAATAGDPVAAAAAASGLAAAAAYRAAQLLAAAQSCASQLAALLAGEEDGGEGAVVAGEEALSQQHQPQQQQQRYHGGGSVVGAVAAAAVAERVAAEDGSAAAAGLEVEMETLRAEVVRLRGELQRALEEQAAAPGGGDGSSFTALELQQSLREAQGELARLRGEAAHLHAAAAGAAREQQATAEALEEARRRLQQQDELHAALVTAAREQEDSSGGLLAELTARRVELEGEVSSLVAQVGSLQQRILELLEERRALEDCLRQREEELRTARTSILEQGADIRNALSLISRPQGPGPGPAPAIATTAATAAAPATTLSAGAAAAVERIAASLALPRNATAATTASPPPFGSSLESALAAALAPYHNASAAIGSALAAAAAIIPPAAAVPLPAVEAAGMPGGAVAGSWLQPSTSTAAAGSGALAQAVVPQLAASSFMAPGSQQLQPRQQHQLTSHAPQRKLQLQHTQPTAPAATRQQQALADLTAVLAQGPAYRAGGGWRVAAADDAAATGAATAAAQSARGVQLPVVAPGYGDDGMGPAARGAALPPRGFAGELRGRGGGAVAERQHQDSGDRCAEPLPSAAVARRQLPGAAGTSGVSYSSGAEYGDSGTAAWRPVARRTMGAEGLLLHAMQGRDCGVPGGGGGAPPPGADGGGASAGLGMRAGKGMSARRAQGDGAVAAGGGGGGVSRLAALRRDMLSLDDEIAQMEESLAVAARRTR